MSWKDAIYEIGELELFIYLGLQGFHQGLEAGSYVDMRRETAQVLRDPDPFATEDEYQNAKAYAAKLQAFAEKQKTSDFAYIYELGAVKLWSILEAMVAELALSELKDPEASANSELLRTLKGPLLEFMQASENERAEFLFAELSNAVKAPLKQGVGKLEAILEALGYGGPINESVRRSLFELSHTRNVVVHRRSIADRAFVKACPWFPVRLGERLRITPGRFGSYAFAARWYNLELDRRIRMKVVGHDMDAAERLRSLFLEEHLRFVERIASERAAG